MLVKLFFQPYVVSLIDEIIYTVFLSQYFGGTNFGRSAGGPNYITSYDYDAPLDEYGRLYNVELCSSGYEDILFPLRNDSVSR